MSAENLFAGMVTLVVIIIVMGGIYAAVRTLRHRAEGLENGFGYAVLLLAAGALLFVVLDWFGGWVLKLLNGG